MATIGMLAMMFLGFTLISSVLGGEFIRSTDVAIINNLVMFKPMPVFGWFTLPIPNFSFITNGLPHLLDFDSYSTIFGGNAQLIAYLLYTITAFVAFALFIAIVGVVAGRIGRT